MNYYERHIGDYLKDTAHLSLLEHGVYCRLMDVYYTREEPIPAADAARLIGARSKDERDALAVVLREFFVAVGDPPTAWLQPRCEQEISRFKEKQAKARRSAETRWSAHRSQSEGSAGAMRTHSESNAPRARPQTPDTSNQEIPPYSPPEGATHKRSPPPKPPIRPDDVCEQTWADWLALRKQKRAPVTPTVLESAIGEAKKAGMPLEQFLRIWCARGSQGLQADWLKPHERGSPPQEPEWRRQQRERNEEFYGVAAARRQRDIETIDMEDGDGPSGFLGG